jgi:hypothetical protein
MDVDKCVVLHNKILKHGWLGSGKTIKDFERECQTWFDHFGEEAEALRTTLSPDLLTFLRGAHITPLDHSFFYYVSGLYSPSAFFEHAELFNEVHSNDDLMRYIVLYAMGMFGNHPVGLM